MSPVAQTPGVLLHEGAIQSVAGLINRRAASEVFLVVDEPAYQACGAQVVLDHALRNIHTTRFSGFQPNPKIEDIQRGVKMFRESAPDLVISIGGGTAIDLGKLISLIGNQDALPADIITGRVKPSVAALPLIAIPTTAGTGSEATHFAVAYIGTQKYSVADPSLIPWQAIVDPGCALPGD
jgi:alcohol dehydrogenase class IV